MQFRWSSRTGTVSYDCSLAATQVTEQGTGANTVHSPYLLSGTNTLENFLLWILFRSKFAFLIVLDDKLKGITSLSTFCLSFHFISFEFELWINSYVMLRTYDCTCSLKPYKKTKQPGSYITILPWTQTNLLKKTPHTFRLYLHYSFVVKSKVEVPK